MFRRSLHTEFPIFFSALVYEFLAFAILFVTIYVLDAPSWYMKVDFFSRAGSTAFHFGILQELFDAPLQHNAALRRTSAHVLRWVTGSLIVIAVLLIGLLYYNSLGHRLLPAYATLEALDIVQCFVLVLVVLWHRFLGIRMSNFAFGIAVGVGVTAALELLAEAWKDLVGPSRACDYLQMSAYLCTVLIWLYYAFVDKNEASQTGNRCDDGRLLNMGGAAADMERMVRK